MVDMLMSMSQFAKEAGVSRQAISKAVAAGALAARPDKKLETTHPINAEYIKNKKREAEETQADKPKNPKSNTSGVNKSNPEVKTDNSVDLIDIHGDLSEYNKHGLDRVKIIRQIKRMELEDNIKRGALVDKKIVRTVFAKLVEIHMNEFLTIKDKLVPDISALFEISDPEKVVAAGERMDEELWKVLNHIKSIFNTFLNEIKEDEID